MCIRDRYKIVARADSDAADATLEPVQKRSPNKATIGGRKYALRRRNARGIAEADVIGIGRPPVDDGDDRALLVPLIDAGRIVGREPLSAARARHAASRAELPRAAHKMSRGDAAIPTIIDPEVQP